MSNQSLLDAFSRMWQHINAKFVTTTALQTATKLYLHKVAIYCSDYTSPPYGVMYINYISKSATPISTIGDARTASDGAVLSFDGELYLQDMPEGERNIKKWSFDIIRGGINVNYITNYTLPLTTSLITFDESVCSVEDTVTEI